MNDGSSPLARGGPCVKATMCTPVRLIPAGAGRTCRQAGASRASSAHPRWRGEDWTTSWVRSRLVGSSPLARGGR